MKIKDFYRIEGKIMEYVNNEKNLKRIRNKTLRQFCRFCRDMEITPFIVGLLSAKSGEEAKDIFMKFQTYQGARRILSDAKEKEMNKNELKILKKYEKKNNVKIQMMTRRNIYDYMYALKYIKACEGLQNKMMYDMITKR